MGKVGKSKLLSKIHSGSKSKFSLLLHSRQLFAFLVTFQYGTAIWGDRLFGGNDDLAVFC